MSGSYDSLNAFLDPGYLHQNDGADGLVGADPRLDGYGSSNPHPDHANKEYSEGAWLSDSLTVVEVVPPKSPVGENGERIEVPEGDQLGTTDPATHLGEATSSDKPIEGPVPASAGATALNGVGAFAGATA